MVVDLENDSVSYLSKAPEGGWPEEYKLTKLVLRKIPAGTFTMGSPEDELGRSGNETPHTVTISKDFYIGVFEITQKQYELITGDDPSDYKGGARPVEHVSYIQRRRFEWAVFSILRKRKTFHGRRISRWHDAWRLDYVLF